MGRSPPGLPEEIQGQEGAVVQRRVPLSQRPGPETGRLRTADDLVPQRSVVLHTQFGLGRTEGGHVSGGTPARRDVEVVGVHDLMG